ncbi:ATP-binding cassette domain-containing protein [Rhodoferax sp.]|uniref:ABC transporter ATP-binding protein n=1 Tax=Rhodoferax sp. TaxID=50421 RepID=UPI00284ED1E0|nr:ATP-binding cassette domain-containing protein [Rhodoferax sp.]MDR3369867.1 ATP-binding cassette domain-containing protein [Rhodoferax sp.]
MPTALSQTDDAARVASSGLQHPSGSGKGIVFDDISVAYHHSTVLDKFSLDVKPGEIMALIGPSGSGKSTALRSVAGFIRPFRGRVHIGSVDVTDIPPHTREIGMVVQNYALFPHMKIEDNVAFGLRARRAPSKKIEQRVAECLTLTGMSHFKGRYPRQLSGGQQQRVAIARALAVEPQVLLLDEPLSALDAQIRRTMVEEIANLHASLPHLTILYVTHDQSEALTLADRIAILKDGKLSSVGTSQNLYNQPPNRFTAEFLGNANLLAVDVEIPTASGLTKIHFHGQALHAHSHGPISHHKALLCVRPHALHVEPDDSAVTNFISGTVEGVYWHGDQQTLRVDCSGTMVRVTTKPSQRLPEVGRQAILSFDPANATIIPVE